MFACSAAQTAHLFRTWLFVSVCDGKRAAVSLDLQWQENTEGNGACCSTSPSGRSSRTHITQSPTQWRWLAEDEGRSLSHFLCLGLLSSWVRGPSLCLGLTSLIKRRGCGFDSRSGQVLSAQMTLLWVLMQFANSFNG